MSSITGPLPENIRRCMAPEERKELNAPTTYEAQAALDLKAERELHKQFSNWCRLNGVLCRHQRMDKPTSEGLGWPDFECRANGLVCDVEFKVGGRDTSAAQKHMIQQLSERQFTVLVTGNIVEAIEWTKWRLEMV